MQESLTNISKNNNSGILNQYAQIIVNVKKTEIQSFTYIVPKEMRTKIKIGFGVLVPFGRQGNVTGIVIELKDNFDENFQLKEIIEILNEKELFTIEYIKLLKWCSDYYCCDIGTMLNLALPSKFLKQSKRIVSLIEDKMNVKLNENEQMVVEYLKSNDGKCDYKALLANLKLPRPKISALISKMAKKDILKSEFIDEESSQKEQTKKYIVLKSTLCANKRRAEILNLLLPAVEYDLTEFQKQAGTTRATIDKMQKEGLIEIIEKKRYRNPLEPLNIQEKETFPKLSGEQDRVYGEIKARIREVKAPKCLLFGITASGKTEVYFNLIRDTLNEGKNVLFLVPEIALASQLTIRIAKRFGTESVAIWHSSISTGEKYDVWKKLLNNEIQILVGARSCVFAPLKNTGLIIADEEHDSGFKQNTQDPRYNAIEVAQKMANILQIPFISGSATPDVSTYYNALNSNNLFKLEKRYNNANLANVTVVDMREEFFKEKRSIFSRLLLNELTNNINQKKQSVILLNRRGFSTHVQCLNCGETIKCPNCDVSLVYHKNSNILKCHLCDYTKEMEEKCPKCGSTELNHKGLGTQKVEELLKKIFPYAKTARIDSDTMTTKTGHIKLLEEFMSGETDILIGTQMIAKGLDNKNVTLVGVIDSDTNFMFPDYRATERGFQLLMQVAGRAGRGEFEGKVIFQTNNPEYYAIETAKKQDYTKFYDEEISIRESLNYPPFAQLFKFVISSKNQDRAKSCIDKIAEHFRQIIQKKGYNDFLTLLGPVECVIAKINSEYRYQFVMKNQLGAKGHKIVSTLYKSVKVANDIKITIDVNPADMI